MSWKAQPLGSSFPVVRDMNMRPKVAIQPIRNKFSGQNLKGSKHASTPTTSSAQKTKKNRASAKKSRQGCMTCKQHHRKCDETRPRCLRCAHGGWLCDYPVAHNGIEVRNYTFPIRKSTSDTWCSSPVYHPTSPLSTYDNPRDAIYLQYLWKEFSHSPAEPFEVPLWATLLQLCHKEPCIKEATLGTAMIHYIHGSISENPGNPKYIGVYQNGFRHYARAVQALNSRLSNIEGKPDRFTWEVSLLMSVLFTIFELLVGNELGAYNQLQSGFKLVKTVLEDRQWEGKLSSILEELFYVWNRVDIQATTFSLGYQTVALFAPTIPNVFLSMYDAKRALERLLPNILAFFRSKDAEWYRCRNHKDPLPEEMAVKFRGLQAILHNWLERFNELLISLQIHLTVNPIGTEQIKLRVAHHTLMIQYYTASMWLETHFSIRQTVYDACLPSFIRLVDLAENILRLYPHRRNHYTSDTQIIQPLSYVGRKCRDGATRRRAIRVLQQAGREGVWDGMCTAAACKWIMLKEEEGLSEGGIGSTDPESSYYIEGKCRLWGATICVNRLGKTLKIRCMRTGDDGVDEEVSGIIIWGEVRSILYGEEDKLWQTGGLFG